MSIGITKNGNLYEKTSSCKVSSAIVGGSAGGYLVLKNLAPIKDTLNKTIQDVSSDLLTDTMKKKFTPVEKWAGEALINLCKYVKKHPLKSGVTAGVTALIGIGAFADKAINNHRAKKADEK